MTTATKALTPFELKASDGESRTFEGLASTWSLDLGNDVIHKGAFAATLKEWKKSGRIIPLIDLHGYRSVRQVLGKLIEAEERDEGLWTKWRVTEGADGDELLHRLRGGMVNGLSIGYQTVKAEWVEDRDNDNIPVRHIKELILTEVSVVIWGMNPEALIDTGSVKSLIDSAKAAIDSVDPEQLTDAQRLELRGIASRIGTLLRPAAPAPKAADPKDKPDPATPPEASPPEGADSQKGENDEGDNRYMYDEALAERIRRLI